MKFFKMTALAVFFLFSADQVLAQYYVLPAAQQEEKEVIFTVGLLNGGSLAGAEAEFEVIQGVGLHAGVGFVGYCAGIDFHFLPTLKSSSISFSYLHQGIGGWHFQSLFAPTFVYRGEKGFSGQIGMGVLTGKGPQAERIFKNEVPSIQPFLSLGYYFGL